MRKIVSIIIVSLAVFGAQPVKCQSISLEKAKEMTLVNNHIIKQSQLDATKAGEVRKEAFTKYFPSVSATGFAMKSSDYFLKGSIPEMNLPVYDGNPANLAGATQFAYFPGAELNLVDYLNNGAVTVMQPVFAGGQIRYGNKLARVATDIAADQNNMTVRDELFVTEKYYWTLANLVVQRKTVAAYKSLLQSLRKDVSVSFENGLVQKSDLLKVDLKLNEVEVNELTLENGIQAVRLALSQQTGIEYSDQLMPADTAEVLLPPSALYVSPDSALRNRPEYNMLSKAVDVSVLQKKMETGKNMPTVAVGAAGIYIDAMDNSTTNGMLVATVSVPISDWWGGSHRIKQKSIEVEKSKSQLADNSEKLLIQQKTAYNTLNEMWSRVSLSAVAYAEAEEHLKVVTDNHRAGMVSMSDLLDAQAMWQQANQQKAEARYSYLIEMAQYKSLTGYLGNKIK
ncbi:MAG: TolC family protein [Bacteroidales bacterium]|nr:TolC family protein [Bacteroidales bacterium]MDD3664715.1 TolC family protein [Bacteroidales bacterium]